MPRHQPLLWPTIQDIFGPQLVTWSWKPCAIFILHEAQEYSVLLRTTHYASHWHWWHLWCRPLLSYCLHNNDQELPWPVSPIKRPHPIRQLWESDTIKCTTTTLWWIPVLWPASSVVQLGCVLFPGRPLCFNNPILEPAISHQLGMWPVRILALTLSGIHLVPSNIQQFHWHAQSYPPIWQYISDTLVSHSVSTLSDKWHNHKVLATPGYNNCSALSNMFITKCCCHRTSRSWQP